MCPLVDKKRELWGKAGDLLQFLVAQGTTEETMIETTIIISNTNSYDVILGMDFLGPCFGFMDPLPEESVWRVDCHETKTMPTRIARILACCQAQTSMERRYNYILSLVDKSSDLVDSTLGEEDDEEVCGKVQ